MKQALAKGESAVQDAIAAALAEYCYAERLRFRHTMPYANQQGFKPGRLCADLAALLSDHTLLILEIKAASTVVPKPVLDSFDDADQLKSYQYFEQQLKVPVHYAFNTVDTLAHAGPAGFSPFMCVQTLNEIGLAKPSAVASTGKVKEVAYSLFEYIRASQPNLGGPPATGPNEAVAKLLSFLTTPISNSALVVVFAPDASTMVLNAAQLRELQQQMLKSSIDIDAKAFPAIAEYLKTFDAAWQADQAAKAAGAEAEAPQAMPGDGHSLPLKEKFASLGGSAVEPALQRQRKAAGKAKR